jgi:hypothetical protein
VHDPKRTQIFFGAEEKDAIIVDEKYAEVVKAMVGPVDDDWKSPAPAV